MVQCMEAWFLADKETLAAYFGNEFNQSTLPGNTSVEYISKKDVLDDLKNSTRACNQKGKYNKGEHSFMILEKIDPEKVFNSSPHAERLIQAMKRRK